jgi:hypothetical protein
MHRGEVLFTLMAGMLSTAAFAAEPSRIVPQEPEPGISGSSLSKQLDRSGGVIRPPAGVDPGIAKPPPAVSPHSTPVVPPPGSPGGNPEIEPK